MILIPDNVIAKLASDAEEVIYDSESRRADELIIENAIRKALTMQSQALMEKLVVIQPAVIPAQELLNLFK